MKWKKDIRQLEWAISFWIGIGLMSIIDVIKIVYTQHALSYSWIMFGFSIIFIIICVILLIKRKKEK
jgi:tellurite resistance protein TehA-like permease